MAMRPTGKAVVGKSILATIRKVSAMAGKMLQWVLRKETSGSANISDTRARASTLGSSTKGMLDFYRLEVTANHLTATANPSTRIRRL